MRALSRDTHRGLWAALPTPWTTAGALDADALTENCLRLAAARVDGIYTTDSDGEFYAIELDEFQQIARAFGRAMEVVARGAKPSPRRTPGVPGEGESAEASRIDAAIGVTWCNTRGIIDRIKAACDAGVPNVHVAFPFFMPLAKSDVDRFFEDLASAVPEARWIHYAHGRTGPPLRGVDYERLAARFPEQLIGTKLSWPDHAQLAEAILGSPELSHFVVDPILLPGMMLGARGCCSYWVNTLPRWQRRYVDACLDKRWDEARRCHNTLLGWEQAHIAPLRAAGHLHAILGKARAALTGFLRDTGITRPPYQPVSESMRAEVKRAFDRYWADELEDHRSFVKSITTHQSP